MASILELDEQLEMYFNIYQDAPENQRNKEVEGSIFGDSKNNSLDDKFFM
jgi:hypothetical protein